MIKRLLPFIFLIILQACQVSEEVTSANQISKTNLPITDFKVVLPNDGWNKLNSSINIALVHAQKILVTGSPYINVQVGSFKRRFYYSSGTDTNSIIFSHTITSSDLDNDGIIISNSVNLNGGTIGYTDSNGLLTEVSTAITIPENFIRVDGIVPTLDSVEAPVNGIYSTNQNLDYGLRFSENVYVNGSVAFNVNLNSGTVAAVYNAGSGSNFLNFRRKVLITDFDDNGLSTDYLLNLDPFTYTDIVDEAGNSLSPIFPVTVSSSVLVNLVGPTVASITPPNSGTYVAGQNLDFTVSMSEAVTVTGSPSLTIQLTTGIVVARYVSGSGTTDLVFRHTVLSGEQDLNDIELNSPLTLNSGSIKNILGTLNAVLSFTAPATTGILVDAFNGPSIRYAYAPPNGMYQSGQNLDFTLIFNRSVIITNTPRLPINLGSSVVYATYQPALSSGSTVTFRYTILNGNNDLDGITISAPLDLNGGTIKDASAYDANLHYASPNTTGIFVDALSPFISSITPPPNANYSPAQNLDFTANFNEPVTVTGTPTIQLLLGVSTVYAQYLSGSGSSSLIFRYTILQGDTDIDGINVVSPFVLSGGTVKDARAQNMTPLTFFPPVTTGVTIDGVKPNITNVTVSPNASYKLLENIDFTVTWSENIVVSGSPKIAFDVGGTTVNAHYQPTLSTSTVSVFRYTVDGGHSDTDGIGPGLALNLGTSTIKDASSNDADLSLTPPTLTGVLVDATIPVILSVTPPANTTYRIGQYLDFTVNWSKGIVVAGGTPYLSLTVGSQTISAVYDIGLSTATASVFRYLVNSGDIDTNGIGLHTKIYLNPGTTIKDPIGNSAVVSLVAPILSAVNVDGVIPVVNIVGPSPNKSYNLGREIDFTFTWSENVVVDTTLGTPRLTLDVGGVTRYAIYISAAPSTTMVFRYTVLTDDLDTDGISLMPISPALPLIDLNLGTIKDLAGNNATNLNFNRPILTGVLVDGKKPIISSVTPPTNDTYVVGEVLTFSVNWSEAMTVDTTGGIPRLKLTLGSSTVYAEYEVDIPSTALLFKYTVLANDEDLNGVATVGPLELNGGTIEDLAGNEGLMTFTGQTYANVKVDAKAPGFVSGTTAQIGYKAGQYIDYLLTFTEPITVTGTPYFVININGTNADAQFVAGTGSGSGTSTIRFRYLVPSNNTLLDLNGITVTPTIVLGGGALKDGVGHDAPLAFTYTEKDFVHYGNTIARYHVSGTNYTYENCGIISCITGLKDISGNANNASASTPRPQLGVGGFGTNATDFIQFNSSGYFNLPYMTNVKYMLIVYRTPTTQPANYWSSESYQYSLLGTNTANFLYLTKTSNVPRIIFSASHIIKINNGALSGYSTSHASSTIWQPSVNYIYQTQSSSTSGVTLSGQRLGKSNFSGQIAEIIFLSSSVSLSATQLDNMTTQLNDIHGVF